MEKENGEEGGKRTEKEKTKKKIVEFPLSPTPRFQDSAADGEKWGPDQLAYTLYVNLEKRIAEPSELGVVLVSA